MATVFKRGGKKAKGYWYASWFDHAGKRRTKCTRTTDKATAERIAKKHEFDAALRRDGVVDPTLDAISRESQRSHGRNGDEAEGGVCYEPAKPDKCETVHVAAKEKVAEAGLEPARG